MMMCKLTHAATLCLAASFLLSAHAQSAAPATPPSQNAPPQNSSDNSGSTGHSGVGSLFDSDARFIKKAAQSSMKEVEVSQAVLPKLSNPDVRNFAQMMVTDHTQANTDLQTLAQTKQVSLPETKERWTKKWSEKTSDVDKDYIKEMVSDHKEAVKLFEKATKSNDPEIAGFAQKTLPTLQHHLEMAQSLKSALSGSSGTTSNETGAGNTSPTTGAAYGGH
ncbi:MAG TPA: DUF4142 domain-containing protein [Opitutaceae bacterium]|nr:DUF4142 domain-containing protein [Opitutaceae bacterium]